MDEKTGTTGSDRPEQSRDDRLKTALKANLARRKRQARAREAAGGATRGGSGTVSGGGSGTVSGAAAEVRPDGNPDKNED